MFFEPISILFGVVTLGLAHFGGNAEMRHEAGCWDALSWYRCHQENFGDIHTPQYMAALRAGHNIHVVKKRGKKHGN